MRAYDRAHLLHRSRAVRTFQNQTASDIVAKVVRDAGLTPKCDASGEPHDFVQQDNETDWDFIWRLADRIGFEVVAKGTVVYFRHPTPDAVTELEWPKTLRSFSPRVTAVQQVQEVTLLAHDPKTKQPIDVSASSPNQIAQIGVDRASVAGAFEDSRVHVATEPVKSRAEGLALVQALLDRLANGYIAAHGIAPGNTKIRAGTQVRVSGVGQKFSGTYRVASCTHVLRGDGYETHFANSPSETILGAIGAAGGSPSFGAQLVLGLVTNNDDPDGMGRVRVRYPALGADVEGAWARIATSERRARARAAHAPRRRRGGAHRLRARRHDTPLRARVAVQRPRRARRGAAAGRGRIVRASRATRRSTPSRRATTRSRPAESSWSTSPTRPR